MPTEKRNKIVRDLQDTLKLLNARQNFALGEFSQSGGELAFVREQEAGNLAVVNVDGHIITIDNEGEVDQEPNIKVRS